MATAIFNGKASYFKFLDTLKKYGIRYLAHRNDSKGEYYITYDADYADERGIRL